MVAWSGKSPLVNWDIPSERCEACERQVECIASSFCLKWMLYFEFQEERNKRGACKLCTSILITLGVLLVIMHLLQMIG
jgi:hypothetical protein